MIYLCYKSSSTVCVSILIQGWHLSTETWPSEVGSLQASCHVYVLCVYRVVCFFPDVLLPDSSCFVATVRICSTTLGSSMLVHILHGLGLLPSGISGKMTVTLDTTTIFAFLVVSMLSLCRATYHLFIKPLKGPWCRLEGVNRHFKIFYGFVYNLMQK